MVNHIPICAGIFIYFGKDGRAQHSGGSEEEILQKVESWMTEHESHENFRTVQVWLEQRQKQVAEAEQEFRVRTKREDLGQRIDKTLRKNAVRDKKLAADIRSAIFTANGIPPQED